MVNLKFEIVWGWFFSIDIFIIVLGNRSFTSEFSDLVVTFFCLRRKKKNYQSTVQNGMGGAWAAGVDQSRLRQVSSETLFGSFLTFSFWKEGAQKAFFF